MHREATTKARLDKLSGRINAAAFALAQHSLGHHSNGNLNKCMLSGVFNILKHIWTHNYRSNENMCMCVCEKSLKCNNFQL